MYRRFFLKLLPKAISLDFDVCGSGYFWVNLLVVVGKWARLVTVTKWMRCYVIALAVIVTTVAASCSMLYLIQTSRRLEIPQEGKPKFIIIVVRTVDVLGAPEKRVWLAKRCSNLRRSCAPPPSDSEVTTVHGVPRAVRLSLTFCCKCCGEKEKYTVWIRACICGNCY